MSFEVVSVVSQTYPQGGGERLLAFVLADFANPAGDRIYPSVATLATRTMLSARTVQRCLAGMVAMGWLEVVGHAAGGRGMATEYRINADWLDRAAMEVAIARHERREPRPVACVLVVIDAPEALKGDILSPFSEGLKGDKNGLKGDKNGLKGDIAMSPQQRTENREEKPPYPPAGGVRDFFGELVAVHPNHRTHTLRSAHRVFCRLMVGKAGEVVDVARFEVMLAALKRDAASEEWMRDGGRWAPRLSTWMEGWALGPVDLVDESVVASTVDSQGWAVPLAEMRMADARAVGPSADVRAALAAVRAGMGVRGVL